MSFDKTVEARLWGITTQVLDVKLPIGDSTGGTHTSFRNPLRGTLLWDNCMYVLKGVSVGGGATGGSFTVTVTTDAVRGYTSLPIARATLGPLSPTMVFLDNLHHSAASPLPTHIFIDQTVANAGSTQAVRFQCYALAKQYRGTLGTPGLYNAERIIMGNLLVGSSATKKFSSDAGIAADVTFIVGTSVNDMGMKRVRLWDSALYWAVAGESVGGTHDVDIISTVNGTTFTVARTGVAGAITAAADKIALTNLYYGQSPNPTHIIWTQVTAGGVSDARVVVLAKTGRGSLAKN